VTVLDGLASLNEQLSRSCLLIHPGGHGMAAAAVLAGVPQIVTSFDVEKWLTGRRLVGRGIALQLDYQTTDARLLRAAILAALDDPVMDLESRQASKDHAAFTHRNIAESVADSCQQLAA
jgi:UDP:flavonoid glycosyltransferase YjiC (YdhE family)